MRHLLLTSLMLLTAFSTNAQDRESFEEFKKKRNQDFQEFKETRRREFDEFRRKRNAEFAEFLRKRWKAVDNSPVIPKPIEKEVPPVVIEEDKLQPPTPRPLPFDEVITITTPKPQPIPIDPIEELPIEEDNDKQEETPVRPVVVPTCKFTYYGTPASVRIDRSKLFKLKQVNENTIANAWLALSEDMYINLIYDCLQIRKEHNLCDWAYLLMLEQMANAVCGTGTNEATLLMAYVYCQSGYTMRLGYADSRLRMLFASEHTIYEHSYYTLDGKKYYIYGKAENGGLHICNQTYPKEQSMSLYIPQKPKFKMEMGQSRSRQSKRYPEIRTTVGVNTNLLKFYESYPTSMADENMMTRWAMYANTPLDESVKTQVYPALRTAIRDCDKVKAVSKLLNYVQTGFEYGYDDQIWGDDRAFFPEESFHYPYSDCEDHSILFTRLVRDLVGLPCILIYYPGHLASAVCFGNANVPGDYILLQGRKFTVCDATYIGADIGRTMPGMDNAKAKVILLE